MGSSPSINQKKCKNLFDYAAILMQDIEIILPQESKQLQNITDNLPIGKLKIINVEGIEMLRQAKAPRILYQEDIQQENLSSFFQKYLLEPYHENQVDPIDAKPSISLIKQIRLMQFDKILKLPKSDCLKPLVKFILSLKEYCMMVNELLKRLNPINLGLALTVYVTLWEQLTFHLPNLRDIYSLALVNKIFNQEYCELNPPLRIEEIVAKIWGTTIKDLYWELFIKEVQKMRINKQQSTLPIAAYFRLQLDMNINQMSLLLIGHFEKMKMNSNGLQILESIFEPRQFYQEKMMEFSDSYEELFEFWKTDEYILKQIFPEWIVDAHFSKAFFELVDAEIHSIIKQMPSEEQNKLRTQILQHEANMKKVEQDLMDIEFCPDFEEFVSIGGLGFEPRKGTAQEIIHVMQSKNQFKSDIFPSITTQGSGLKYVSTITKPSNYLEKIEEEVHNEQEIISDQKGFVQSEILEQNQVQQQEQQKQQIDKQLNDKSQADEILEFCNLYDKSKWRVMDAINYRNNSIEFRNAQFGYSANVFESPIFNFKHTVTEDEAQDFLNKLKEMKQFNQNQQYEKQIPIGQKLTLAEELLARSE